MTFEQALKQYGTYKALAEALKLPPTTVHSWRSRGIPRGRQYELQVLTGGKLRADNR